MKKIILTIVSLIVIILLSILIGNNKNKTNKIVVAEVTHSVFYAPWYVALENGYFKEEGLDIEVMLTPGADKVATAVLSQDADIGFSGPEATIYVYNNSKEKLITFASLTKRDGQFIVGDCSLKDNFTMNDLIGKKVLAGRSGGMPLMMFEYALYKSNVDKSLVIIDTSIDFAGLTGAFIGKQGDFVNLFQPNALNIEKEKVIVDDRIIEVNFGKYELHHYYLLGLRFSLFWAFPEFFKEPESVESICSMVKRSSSFLKELESKNYENVLIVCHGGIIRALCGYLEDKENGIKWRPKPHNCEIRVYESINGKHKTIKYIK